MATKTVTTGARTDFLPQTLRGESRPSLISRIRKGEARSRVDEVASRIGLTDKEMARILNLSERSLHRQAGDKTLDSNKTERLLLLEQLIEHGLATFDDRQAVFARWLRTPRPSLGNVAPVSLLDTIAGFSFVDDELSRIEEGMIS
ncbi:antitoxin Xre-like helix-turn-helix domain-containing protein [Spirosoma sp. KNUC1025]|uniref:type II RES/Xre toxin-antitoxin system antitoxin n=1 Tax=Spirosoma sp. KNUC1025 TaxID=2894082 RepID=UPI001E393D09|nr:antitoxin Xre-like helix-turn-helix domain-containing protein [Spirosoma sp. KNUC1025]UFH57832.1 MbcA/ParS/Xre antitoxin family protein [Spirosoma sp. KNUC1025]